MRKRNGIPDRKQLNLASFEKNAMENFLQLKRSVPCMIFLIILMTECFKRREENAWHNYRYAENLANFSELMEIVRSIF